MTPEQLEQLKQSAQAVVDGPLGKSQIGALHQTILDLIAIIESLRK